MGSRDHRRRRGFDRRPYNPNAIDRPPTSETPIGDWNEEGDATPPRYNTSLPEEPMARPRRRGGEGYESQERLRDMNRSMRDMFFRTTAQVTVVLVTHQAEPYLEPLLQALKNQDAPYRTEILVLDDNSTDRTPLILRSRGIRNYPITSKRGVRETAARLAEGDVLVFLTQDSLPMDRMWLKRLVAPVLDPRPVLMTHGRLMADASVPPYQRGLIQARPYVSGSKMLFFQGIDGGEGADIIPHTNVAISKDLLFAAGTQADDDIALLQKLYATGKGKLYLPAPVAAVRRGELPKRFLAPETGRSPDGLARELGCHGRHLLSELREIGQAGELPSGERGEAYAVAIAIRAAQAASLIANRCPRLVGAASKLAPKLHALLPKKSS